MIDLGQCLIQGIKSNASSNTSGIITGINNSIASDINSSIARSVASDDVSVNLSPINRHEKKQNSQCGQHYFFWGDC